MIDSKLTWRQHVLHLEKKLSTACALISKLRYYVDQKCLLQYYYAHVYSHLQYAILAWGSTNKTTLNKLNVLYRRVVRLLTLHGPLQNFFKYNEEEIHGNIKNIELFKSTEILTIEDIYNLELAKFMHKASTNSLPDCLNEIFTRSPYPRRLFVLPAIRSNKGERSLRYAGPKLWESIPSNLKSDKSIKTFAKQYKNYLLDGYT